MLDLSYYTSCLLDHWSMSIYSSGFIFDSTYLATTTFSLCILYLLCVLFFVCIFVLFCFFCREFNTSVDIELHKWADSLELAQLATNVRAPVGILNLHIMLTRSTLTSLTHSIQRSAQLIMTDYVQSVGKMLLLTCGSTCDCSGSDTVIILLRARIHISLSVEVHTFL